MKYSVLYISKNIPTPNKPENKVILAIADRLLKYFDIEIIYPKEKYFFFLRPFSKYKYLRNLKPWRIGEVDIRIWSYLRLPVKSSAFLLTRIFLKFPRNIDQNHLIHAHFLLPDGLLAYYSYQKYKMPYIISLRSSGVRLIMELKKHKKENSDTYQKLITIIHHSASIICHNEAYAKLIHNEFGKVCEVIPHGMNSNYRLLKTPTYNQRIQIVTAGKIISIKRIEWVIHSFIEAKMHFDNIELWVMGDGQELPGLLKKYNHYNDIVFTGFVEREKLLDKLTESQIFILPSKWETYGLVYNEAASRHNAIIGTRGQGIYGIFEENKEALYCQNQGELTEKLILLLKNSELRKSLADAALEKIQGLSWERIIERYKALYEQCITEHNPDYANH
ncbi:MAG TPA: glycosyltransferase family 4 protein [Saprospiraceae bacterium]|nr:glycosyltransferase family 4 protein [Saprospiraceae bacterium]